VTSAPLRYNTRCYLYYFNTNTKEEKTQHNEEKKNTIRRKKYNAMRKNDRTKYTETNID